jgi:hypothetical protein
MNETLIVPVLVQPVAVVRVKVPVYVAAVKVVGIGKVIVPGALGSVAFAILLIPLPPKLMLYVVGLLIVLEKGILTELAPRQTVGVESPIIEGGVAAATVSVI